MSRRGWVVLILGLGALGTIGGMAPWIYRRIRIEQVLARLEAGDDAAARAELVELKGLERVVTKLVESKDTQLAGNAIEFAVDGLLSGPARKEAFDLYSPAWFDDPQSHGLHISGFFRRDRSVVTARVQDSLWEMLDMTSFWTPKSFPGRPSAGGAELYVQFFLVGDGAETRLVYQRDTWVVHPMGPNGPLLDAAGTQVIRVESIDATDIPDPLGLFPRRPAMVILPSGESALELRLASMGTWRQFVPGRKLYDGSVAHAVYLDRSAEKKDPFLLGYVGVSDSTALGKWFAEDAVLKKPLENLDRGAHWINFHVPRDVAKLEPLAKFTLLFRPSPSFAERNGFQVSPTECQPFERVLYLPLHEK